MTSVPPADATGRIAEVFRSFQGEAALLGTRQVFVRLAECSVGCRYCDTEWAFAAPSHLAVPNRPGERVANPMDAAAVVRLVDAADPSDTPGGPCAVSLTGGEPTEQPDFAAALCRALRPRDVMLETAGLDGAALARLAPLVRWVSCDIKLPSSTGRATVLDEHEAVLASGVLRDVETWFKLVVDGAVTEVELVRAADLLARHAPSARVFVQPVTPLGGSPALPRERLDPIVDLLAARGLDVRVVPQVHKVLRVR